MSKSGNYEYDYRSAAFRAFNRNVDRFAARPPVDHTPNMCDKCMTSTFGCPTEGAAVCDDCPSGIGRVKQASKQ